MQFWARNNGINRHIKEVITEIIEVSAEMETYKIIGIDEIYKNFEKLE